MTLDTAKAFSQIGCVQQDNASCPEQERMPKQFRDTASTAPWLAELSPAYVSCVGPSAVDRIHAA